MGGNLGGEITLFVQISWKRGAYLVSDSINVFIVNPEKYVYMQRTLTLDLVSNHPMEYLAQISSFLGHNIIFGEFLEPVIKDPAAFDRGAFPIEFAVKTLIEGIH